MTTTLPRSPARTARDNFLRGPGLRDWTARQTARGSRCIAQDLITKPACARSAMSREELEDWLRRDRADGVAGLKRGLRSPTGKT